MWLRVAAIFPLPQLPPALAPLRLRLGDVQGDVLVSYLMAQVAASTPWRAWRRQVPVRVRVAPASVVTGGTRQRGRGTWRHAAMPPRRRRECKDALDGRIGCKTALTGAAEDVCATRACARGRGGVRRCAFCGEERRTPEDTGT